MNKCKYIVTWYHPGFPGTSKIYKYRKSAFTFAQKLKFIFGSQDVEILVEEMQKREDGKVIRTGRWEI